MPIYFHTEAPLRFTLRGKRNLRSWLDRILTKEGKRYGDINYIFCSDEYLLNLNKEYLNHDYYTDILSFQDDEAEHISGDMFISLDRVKDNAAGLDIPYYRELHRVMVHGLLHFIGYNDKGKIAEQKMRAKENEALLLLDDFSSPK